MPAVQKEQNIKTPDINAAFLKILNLATGDFIAKTFNFFTFVYLARVLGIATYGVLEFAFSSALYFYMVADAGIESWATRETSRGNPVHQIASRILPLRLLLALIIFSVLFISIPLFPDYPHF